MIHWRQASAAVVDSLRKEEGWVTANLIGMSIGILSQLWLIIPIDTEAASTFVLALVGAWVITAYTTLLAIFLLLFLMNVVWLEEIIWHNRGPQLRRAFWAWFLVCCLWLPVLGFNRLTAYLLVLATSMIEGRLLPVSE